MGQNRVNNVLLQLTEKIERGEEISPFLFVGENLEIVNLEVENLAKSLLREFDVPVLYLYVLRDNKEKLKVKDVKDFAEFSNSKSPYRFQIFFIENISNLTPQASSSLLKLLEEPWTQNLIFLSNNSESNVLDTILSRVQIVDLSLTKKRQENEFFQGLIRSYVNSGSQELVTYFFKNKLEKEEYLEFLENLIIYAKKNFCFIDLLDELEEDMNWIKQNNLIARFIVDKWIIKIK